MNVNRREYRAYLTALEKIGLAVLILVSGYAMLQRHREVRELQATPLRVTFLDVGKADAIVIETPAGKTLVVDTGGTRGEGEDMGRRVVAPFLRSRGIQKIDTLL